MSRRILSAFLALALVVCAPCAAMAKAKQMEDGVPVWNEKTVRDYLYAYTTGKIMNTLWGYYDLQIRRYMPMQTYENMLSELEWMTGKLVALGEYRCFEEPEYETKTHVIHMHMEKTDLDMYFTHKNKPDDWEVMAVEFVPTEKVPLSDENSAALSNADVTSAEAAYDEVSVTVGKAENGISGVLTIPREANEQNPVPGCVIAHDWGALDKDGTLGGTAMYADLAHALADMGIASLRYDSRTLANKPDPQATADEELIADALEACDMLLNEKLIDKERVVLIGHGIGAMLAPRAVKESDGKFTAMIMIAGAYTTPVKQLVKMDIDELRGLDQSARQETVALTEKLLKDKRSNVDDYTILGRGGIFFWEIERDDQIALIKRLKVPTFIVQGDKDPYVSEDDGWRAYAEAIGDGATYMSFKSFRGLNHLLMADTATDVNGMPDYGAAAALDKQAGVTISQWILNLFREE